MINNKCNWLKLGMGVSLPATDGKAIYFSCVCFKIMLLFFLVFVSNSYYSQNKNQGSKGSSPDCCFKNSIKTFKRTSCDWEKHSKSVKFIQNTNKKYTY